VKPIFIVGPHRAGSTLWHNVIAMKSGVLRLPEARFLGPRRQKDFRYFLRTEVGDLSKDENIDKLVRLCFSRKDIPGLAGALWRWEGLGLVKDPALYQAIAREIKGSDRSLGAIARVIIEELTRFSGNERVCVKFPVDVRHMDKLFDWFPDCRVVHITRDPRALAMSKSNDPSGTAKKVAAHPRFAWVIRKAALALVISQYRLSARMHRRCKGTKNYRLFCYEDLLANPRRTLLDLCKFTEIDFHEDMLEPQKGQHEHQPSSLTGRQQKAFDAEAAIRWQRVISPFDNFVITAGTRSSMKELGYDPGTHPIFQKRPSSRDDLKPVIAS